MARSAPPRLPKKIRRVVGVALLASSMILPRGVVQASESAPDPLGLWFNKPASYLAKTCSEGGAGTYRTLLYTALLIGNGRFGAMIQGGTSRELLRLSEKTMWTGGGSIPDGHADDRFGAFQPLGDLSVDFTGQGTAEHYRRSLSLNDAISTVTYTADGVAYRREYFASHPDEVIAVRFSADRPGRYSGSLFFTDAHNRISLFEKNRITTPGGFINGLRYEAQTVVLHEGGSLEVAGGKYEERLEFKNCDSLTILVACGTNYVMDYQKRYLDKELPHLRVSRQIDAAAAQGYAPLRRAHIADYQALFNRFSLDLGSSTAAQRALPTDERLARATSTTDPEFEQMFCQYGRYLTISCSRAGGVGANGFGLWNDCNFPQFAARYTNDIAPTELAYWAVEPCNLAECHLPLLDLIQSQIPVWRKDAQTSPELKTTSGGLTTRGWEIRGDHNIMGGQAYAWNKGGMAWYCHHFWEHYAFSQDREFLQKVVYPMLKELCEYWEDHLKPLPDGRLIVTDTWSPEHGPFHQDGVSYSQELVWDLFTNYLDATEILGVDREYRTKVTAMREKLLKPGIGSWGQLLEWMTEMKDFPAESEREKKEVAAEGHIDTPENHHRHNSHLLGVYPLRQISCEQTPDLAAAAKVSAVARGDSKCWMSYPHLSFIFARLDEGDLAYEQVRRYFKVVSPNLFGAVEYDTTPALPGTFAEMLLQSHQHDLHVLPALPGAWPSGSVKGLRARGGYEVDEEWRDRKLVSLTIHSVAGHSVQVRYGDKKAVVDLHPGESAVLDGDLRPMK